MNNINVDDVKSMDDLKKLIKFIMEQSHDVTTFAGYDLGIGIKKEDMKGFKDESLNYCQNFELGILNQGFFQMTTFNNENWSNMRQYILDNKDDISKVHFFFLSTSLVANTSPILLYLPLINIFHTAIGMQIIGKNGKIKRNATFQLEFGDINSVGDAIARFLAPEFCMTPVFKEDGSIKNPLEFTNEEFNKNLFIDYSKSISSIMGNFLEQEDYVTDDLVSNMSCVDAINLSKSAPMPYDNFLKQNFTMKHYYDAYLNYKNSKQNIGGDADGTIFCLTGFGPSPLSKNSGVILNFASCNNIDDVIKIIDFTYTNYNGCSNDFLNSNQHYCLIGIDKAVPVDELSNNQINELLKKPNIISIENGFIREMRGRTTHCNTTCAVYVTLIEQLAKENPKNWEIHTNWNDIKIQEDNFYMLNPSIPNLPIAVFPEGWEYGVNMKDFNNNPIYAEDKKKFYQYMFFIRMLAFGMVNIGEQQLFEINTGKANIYQKIFYYAIDLIENTTLKTIFKDIFSNKIYSKYMYTYWYLMSFMFLYLIIKLDLYDYAYWATGQSTIDKNGYNINMTDPYPTIWKIDIKQNIPVLLSYIENFFLSSNPLSKFEGKNAGQIYLENKDSYSLYDGFNQLNRWLHPFPMNKFFLWFPGVRWNNVCNQVKLPNNIVFYQPNIEYSLVKNGAYTLGLSKWQSNNQLSNYIENKTPLFDGRVTATIVITTLIILILVGLYIYFIYFYK